MRALVYSPKKSAFLVATPVCAVPNVRLTMQTHDQQLIYMTYRGYRHGPQDVIDRLNRGEAVDPSLYYFRVTPYFETGAKSYDWINKICSIATGARTASGPTYHVFQVL